MTPICEKEAMPQIESTRFGAIDVEPDAILEFPEGLIGLRGTSYALISPQPGSVFRWLQSTDDPALALPVTQPWTFFAGFEVSLSDDETDRLGLPADITPDVWVTVRATGDPQSCSVNLKAPILVHEGRAHQVINEAPDAPVRAPLFPAGAGAPDA